MVAGATDPLIFDAAETSVEATAFAVQALVKRDPTNPLIERCGAMDDGESHGGLLVVDEADGDGDLRIALVHAGAR